MATTDTKPVQTHLENVDTGTKEAHADPTQSTLKITRDSWWDNKKGIFICILINMVNFEYGLDQGMVNGFQAMGGFLQDFGYADPALPGGYGITTTMQQLITSLVSAGMFVTTFAAGYVTSKIGRKGGIWVGFAFMILSVTLQIAVINEGALYSGRLLLGFANGFLVVSAQLYMQEAMPSNLRSLSFTLYQFWISFGGMLGVIINNETKNRLDRSSYRIPLGVLYIIPVVLSVILIWLPETPRYLASRGNYDEAAQSLRFLRDKTYSDLMMFQGLDLKRTLTALGIALYSAANGVPFVIQYGVYFFLQSSPSSDPFQSGIIVTSVGLVGVLVTPLFTGKIGKRPILMTGGIVQALCMLGIGLSYTVRGTDPLSGRVILAMAAIFLFTASATTSPFSWQVTGEVPTQRLRSYTLGFSSAITFLCGWSITFTIPYFINPTALNWGAQYAYIWFAGNLLIAVFTFFVVPETNKRTLEEIDECYVNRVPIRKFPSYECVGTVGSRMEAVRNIKGESN
ncbi:putative sugar transporter [Polyplosphaeria fusca]|uniref:Sugar transporter n=1 Tax=Polyplosphaeria fusca TaxID=682080 RepID=A0A9P4V0Y3_9PLEO|nr:putative sugar transporter [Polyplosphaeria fusca]